MNYIDIIIICILLFYGLRGLRTGFIGIVLEIIGYILSYYVSIRYSYLVFNLIYPKLNFLPKSYIDILAIVLCWTIFMFVYYIIAPLSLKFIPNIIIKNYINQIAGFVGSVIKGLIIVTVIVYVVVILPIPNNVKTAINSSYIASNLLYISKELAGKYGANISQTISQIATLPTNLLSNNTSQNGEKLIELGFKTTNTTVSKSDETTMFNFINSQRESIGLQPLKLNKSLSTIAENYGKYMYTNGFFSHITPQGQTPLDRIQSSNLNFVYVGENIALAPNVSSADIGFMKSVPHRENILNQNYTDVGIGVINGGKSQYEEIFVQDFIGQ